MKEIEEFEEKFAKTHFVKYLQQREIDLRFKLPQSEQGRLLNTLAHLNDIKTNWPKDYK